MGMTREEYRIKVAEYFVEIKKMPSLELAKAFSERVNFPLLLNSMAIEFFMHAELVPLKYTELIGETKRRLSQLETAGTTDE